MKGERARAGEGEIRKASRNILKSPGTGRVKQPYLRASFSPRSCVNFRAVTQMENGGGEINFS